MIFTRPCKIRALGFGPEIPSTFSSLDEARNNLDWHWRTCETFLAGSHGDKDPKNFEGIHLVCESWAKDFRGFAVRIDQWSIAFQAFLRKAGNCLNIRELQAAHILEIHYHFLKTYAISRKEELDVNTRKEWLDSCGDQMAWDQFIPVFDRIVSLASLIVDSDSTFQGSIPSFCLDSNIVAPLYAVAHRCRDPLIRREAVSMLRKFPVLEGMWDSVLTTKVAETVIAIEEDGLGDITSCADVPGWARIGDVNVIFDMEGRVGTLNFRRPKMGIEGSDNTIIETFTW